MQIQLGFQARKKYAFHKSSSDKTLKALESSSSLSRALTLSLEPDHWVTVGFLDVLVHRASICKNPLTEGTGELFAEM